MSAKDLVIAIDRDDADELAIVLSFTNEGINDEYKGGTPLWHTIQKQDINWEIFWLLLEAGAEPNLLTSSTKLKSPFEILLERGYRDMAIELAKRGAVLDIYFEPGLIEYLLWGESYRYSRLSIDELSKDDFLGSCHKFFGSGNPDILTDEYKLAAVKWRGCAYFMREIFKYDIDYDLILKKGVANLVWCWDRIGQSLNVLDDLTMVLVAGEHEDGGTSDFWIYNDVTVISPEGQIEIYGYPPEVFPPTDFHTATRVGEWIYIIGSLGYQGTQPDIVSVYRLSLQDYHIEQCPTTGDVPPQMCRHSAKLIDGHIIRTWGGKWSKPFSDRPKDHFHELDLNSMEWRRIDSASKV